MSDDSFSSLDKLMEFGLGMGIAQQMVNTMNQTMANMQVPGVNTAVNPMVNDGSGYFVLIDNVQAGPFNEAELVQFVKNGKLTGDTLVWRRGMSGWSFAKNCCDINKLLVLNK
jgi:hypothetical protein